MRNVSNDVTIISGDNEEIQTNKYILSLFCPSLRHLLSTSFTLLLPECSTFSIKYLLIVINNGFVITEKLSNEDTNEILETAQVLSIEMRELYHDKTVSNIVKSNKVTTSPRLNTSKKSAIDVSEKRNDENPESILDVMDSLMRIFDPDYKDEEVIQVT